MRIGLDLRRIHDTGIGRVSRNLLRAMIEADADHEFTAVLASPADIDALAIDADALHYRFAPAPKYSVRELSSMWRIAHRDALQVVHAPHQFYFPWWSAWATVVTVHDVTQLRFASSRKARWRAASFAWFLKGMCARADAVMTVSEASRDSLIEVLGVAPEKLYLAPNAVDDIFVKAPPCQKLESFRRAMRLPSTIILYVGMLKAHKNLGSLVKAFARYTQAYGRDNISLVIVGNADSNDRQSLYNLARAWGVHDIMRFTGGLSDADLSLMYRVADVLVNPSLHEGFGLTPLEAMACGVPVVASRIPSHQEVCGDAALLVEPLAVEAMAEAIAAVLRDSALAAELRRRGLTNAQRYSWRETGRRVLRLYDMAHQRYLRKAGRS